MAMARRTVLLWTISTWIAVLIGTGCGATINISLHMEPPDLLPLCPGVRRIELHCVHTAETHDPGWRVRGDGLPKYGYAQFGQGLLEHHLIVKDTDTVEVLQIDPVMSPFTYYCLYVIRGEEVITEPLTLDVIDPYEAVTDLLVTIVSESEAVVQWNHTDECEVADRYEVVVRDFTGDFVLNETTKGLMKVLEHLQANGKYEVTVSMIGKDGGRGEATSLVFKAGVGVAPTAQVATLPSSVATTDQGQNDTAPTVASTLCDVSQVSCSLYTLAAVLIVLAVIVVLVVVLVKCSRSRQRSNKESATYGTAQLPNPSYDMPVHQHPEPGRMWTNSHKQSYMYENVAFHSLPDNHQHQRQSLAEPGTFV